MRDFRFLVTARITGSDLGNSRPHVRVVANKMRELSTASALKQHRNATPVPGARRVGTILRGRTRRGVDHHDNHSDVDHHIIGDCLVNDVALGRGISQCRVASFTSFISLDWVRPEGPALGKFS